MRLPLALLVSLPVLGWTMLDTQQALACGGCFVSQSENTVVTGHRMILSVSKDQTTLYDQIQYSGDPQDFAWVLPIRGQVAIGLSSDALFAQLELDTTVSIVSPPINCASSPNSCDNGAGGSSAGGQSAGFGGNDGGVEIIAEQVVGPYETVQLSASDPAALETWLADHGYNIPDAVQPIIDDYVNDGMDFLALRLAPGQGVRSMRPVRVTTPGGGPVLPLRMVAAGTGAKTAITLFVVSEGRYEPQNFPSFLIREEDLVWNWDTQRSNFSDLRAAGFEAFNGRNWLVEAAEPYSASFGQLFDLVSFEPAASGYADDNGENALANAEADIAVLTAGLNGVWINRIAAELPAAALGDDLVLRASTLQTAVQRSFQVTETVGVSPCPPVLADPCAGDGSGGGAGKLEPQGGLSGCNCSVPGNQTHSALGGLLAVGLGCAAVGRRRRRPAIQR